MDNDKKNRVDVTIKLLQRLEALGNCHDSGCSIIKSSGQHTNGGKCTCPPERLQKALLCYRMFVQDSTQDIKDLIK